MNQVLQVIFSSMIVGGGFSAGCGAFFGLAGGDKRMCGAGIIIGGIAAVAGSFLMPLVTP